MDSTKDTVRKPYCSFKITGWHHCVPLTDKITLLFGDSNTCHAVIFKEDQKQKTLSIDEIWSKQIPKIDRNSLVSLEPIGKHLFLLLVALEDQKNDFFLIVIDKEHKTILDFIKVESKEDIENEANNLLKSYSLDDKIEQSCIPTLQTLLKTQTENNESKEAQSLPDRSH